MENLSASVDANKAPRFFKWVLALAIVIVLNLFFAVAVRVLYEEPMHEDFCNAARITAPLDTKEMCEAVEIGGEWQYSTGPRAVKPVIGEVIADGWCNADFTCWKEYDDALAFYNRNAFVILVILGLVSIGIGYMFAASASVSLGLSLGGVVSLIIASVRYWSHMDEYLHLVILAVALILLIWFGIKKFRD